MITTIKEEQKYLSCSVHENSGNYSLFFYNDGYLTAYNEDAKVEHYLSVSSFNENFLKNEQIQQLEPVLHLQNTV